MTVLCVALVVIAYITIGMLFLRLVVRKFTDGEDKHLYSVIMIFWPLWLSLIIATIIFYYPAKALMWLALISVGGRGDGEEDS